MFNASKETHLDVGEKEFNQRNVELRAYMGMKATLDDFRNLVLWKS